MPVNFQNSTRTAVTVAATGNTQCSTTMAECREYDILIRNTGAAALYIVTSAGTSSTITVAAGAYVWIRGVKNGDFPYMRSSSGNLAIIYRVVGHQDVVERQYPENHPLLQQIYA